MSNIITFKNAKPAAALILSVGHEEEPYEPDYYCTKENIIRVTEDMLAAPLCITVAEDHLRQIDDPDLAAMVDETLDALNAFRLDLLAGYDAQVRYYDDEGYGPTTRVWVLYIDYISRKADLRLYRNRQAAKGQVTKFFHRVAKIKGTSIHATLKED